MYIILDSDVVQVRRLDDKNIQTQLNIKLKRLSNCVNYYIIYLFLFHLTDVLTLKWNGRATGIEKQTIQLKLKTNELNSELQYNAIQIIIITIDRGMWECDMF